MRAATFLFMPMLDVLDAPSVQLRVVVTSTGEVQRVNDAVEVEYGFDLLSVPLDDEASECVGVSGLIARCALQPHEGASNVDLRVSNKRHRAEVQDAAYLKVFGHHHVGGPEIAVDQSLRRVFRNVGHFFQQPCPAAVVEIDVEL